MPRVCVVIPAFNAAKFLAETIESVLRSTFGDYELFVINDGSTDQTEEIASRYSQINLICQDNAGLSAARNIGINASDSEFIALLDSDDLWHPEKLRMQLDALRRYPDYDYCYTAFSLWNGQPQPSFFLENRSGKIDDELSGWIYHKLILDNWALPSSLLFSRNAWNIGGPFLCENQQTDDWEYIVRSSHNFKFIRLEEPFVLYRQHQHSLSRRMPDMNYPEMMRESLLQRFGNQSPGGAFIDEDQLNQQRYLGWSNFADAHCARGDLRVGIKSFAQLIVTGPRRAESIGRLGKSIYRRAFPKK
ncbi:glycosyltransferase family 2 protein [Allochromatium vinosum]|uniref:glycosyltransferase family 2 protein n=1 Tax=Allochromatium vinosum TaxID=1049 RepID=UPI0019075DFD|nr:glycosyltransferase family 2 protein [Allochromatium vinosum]MBK1656441.1 hypothetical protein [Allochromatium vinosum]